MAKTLKRRGWDETCILEQIGCLDLPISIDDRSVSRITIMPNHLHGINIIRPDPVGSNLVAAPPDQAETSPDPTVDPSQRVRTNPGPVLGDIIGAFKSITTHEYILGVRLNKWLPFNQRLWQRNYYEHILRSSADLDQVRAYIRANPLQWSLDLENPALSKKRS